MEGKSFEARLRAFDEKQREDFFRIRYPFDVIRDSRDSHLWLLNIYSYRTLIDITNQGIQRVTSRFLHLEFPEIISIHQLPREKLTRFCEAQLGEGLLREAFAQVKEIPYDRYARRFAMEIMGGDKTPFGTYQNYVFNVSLPKAESELFGL